MARLRHVQIFQDARLGDKQLHSEPGRLRLLFSRRTSFPDHHGRASPVDLRIRLLQALLHSDITQLVHIGL